MKSCCSKNEKKVLIGLDSLSTSCHNQRGKGTGRRKTGMDTRIVKSSSHLTVLSRRPHVQKAVIGQLNCISCFFRCQRFHFPFLDLKKRASVTNNNNNHAYSHLLEIKEIGESCDQGHENHHNNSTVFFTKAIDRQQNAPNLQEELIFAVKKCCCFFCFWVFCGKV